jgi:hypothetical protein
VLISIRSSRPVFRVEEWNLFVADTRDIGMSQEYIVLLAQQRGLPFRAFSGEKDAAGWLLEAAKPSATPSSDGVPPA